MHPQLQLLVALQDLDQMIRETEESREQLEDLGFRHEGLASLKSGREELAAKIDPSLASWYKRLTARFGHAVVPVVSNLCTGCFASIPPSFVSKTNVDKVQKCESCGRLLYWP